VAISTVTGDESGPGLFTWVFLVKRNVATPHQAAQADRELVTNDISALLQRVAGSSVAEIDRLMSALQTLRDLLHSEGARVQREIAGYAHLSQSVVQSTKIISESLAKVEEQKRAGRLTPGNGRPGKG